MAIYIDFEGIKGDATHSKHKKWLDIESLQWGVGRAIMTPSGSAQNREASEPSVSEVTVTKRMDSSSALLFQEACAGNAGKKVTIDLVTTGDPGDIYMTYTLHNALVSGYSISTGGDRPTESVSLNFTKIEMKYTQFDEKNKVVNNFPASYDLATTKTG
jgi:type VI secretion system secreted protein Hcp